MSATPGMMEPAAMIYKPEDESEVSEGEDRNLKKKATEKKWVGCIGGCSGCHFLYDPSQNVASFEVI